ncbi:MAG: hypothetical protein RR726_39665, partial [Pseudomonas sp.]
VRRQPLRGHARPHRARAAAEPWGRGLPREEAGTNTLTSLVLRHQKVPRKNLKALQQKALQNLAIPLFLSIPLNFLRTLAIPHPTG